MSDIWAFFIFPAIAVLVSNKLLIPTGVIQKGGIAGRTIEWLAVIVMIIGILRSFSAAFLQ